MLLTQVLLMLLSVLTEAELNWQRGGRHIKLSVCVCMWEREKLQLICKCNSTAPSCGGEYCIKGLLQKKPV